MMVIPNTNPGDTCEAVALHDLQSLSSMNETSEANPLPSYIFHDLRHPLTAILAYSELLAGDDLDGLQRGDFHQEIRLAVTRMNDLLSLLLEGSRGPAASDSEVADIEETVKHAIQSVVVRPEFRRIEIRHDHRGATTGCFDSRRLQRVIINLVVNACEAVPPGKGRIEVQSWGRHNRVEICVRDNGPGIPEPIRHSVFRPFVSFGKEGGSGLGLAIVQKILHDLGGELFLASSNDNGTLFRFVIPYAGPQPVESLTAGPAYGSIPANRREGVQVARP